MINHGAGKFPYRGIAGLMSTRTLAVPLSCWRRVAGVVLPVLLVSGACFAASESATHQVIEKFIKYRNSIQGLKCHVKDSTILARNGKNEKEKVFEYDVVFSRTVGADVRDVKLLKLVPKTKHYVRNVVTEIKTPGGEAFAAEDRPFGWSGLEPQWVYNIEENVAHRKVFWKGDKKRWICEIHLREGASGKVGEIRFDDNGFPVSIKRWGWGGSPVSEGVIEWDYSQDTPRLSVAILKVHTNRGTWEKELRFSGVEVSAESDLPDGSGKR